MFVRIAAVFFTFPKKIPSGSYVLPVHYWSFPISTLTFSLVVTSHEILTFSFNVNAPVHWGSNHSYDWKACPPNSVRWEWPCCSWSNLIQIGWGCQKHHPRWLHIVIPGIIHPIYSKPIFDSFFADFDPINLGRPAVKREGHLLKKKVLLVLGWGLKPSRETLNCSGVNARFSSFSILSVSSLTASSLWVTSLQWPKRSGGRGWIFVAGRLLPSFSVFGSH